MTALYPSPRPDTTPTALTVRHVSVTPASGADKQTGILAWAIVDLGALILDSVAVRLTSKDEIVVVMPATKRRSGRRYPVVTILDAGLRNRIHAAVLAEYAEVVGRAARGAP